MTRRAMARPRKHALFFSLLLRACSAADVIFEADVLAGLTEADALGRLGLQHTSQGGRPLLQQLLVDAAAHELLARRDGDARKGRDRHPAEGVCIERQSYV